VYGEKNIPKDLEVGYQRAIAKWTNSPSIEATASTPLY